MGLKLYRTARYINILCTCILLFDSSIIFHLPCFEFYDFIGGGGVKEAGVVSYQYLYCYDFFSSTCSTWPRYKYFSSADDIMLHGILCVAC